MLYFASASITLKASGLLGRLLGTIHEADSVRRYSGSSLLLLQMCYNLIFIILVYAFTKAFRC